MLLSVIVPCYNEEENVPIFYEEMMKNSAFLEQEKLELEIIYIDDGSKDNTAAEVRKLHEKDERVHLVSFSRNFGKEAGIYAGFQKAKGDYVVMMDADLQDPPSLLPEMFSYIKQGYDSVATRRVTRKGEPPIRSFFARMFYRIMNKISKTEIVDRLWIRFFRCANITVLRKEFSAGSAMRRSGWSMKTWNAPTARQNGASGSCFCIRWMELPHFQQCRWQFRLSWALCSAL